MTTSKSNWAYDTLISLQDKLTCFNCVITPEAVNKLKDELGRIFTVAKKPPLRSRSEVRPPRQRNPEPKYRLIIGNAAWVHGVPANSGAYSQAALGIGNATTLQEQLVGEHKILQKSYNDYLGTEEAGKELILYAVGDNASPPLKKQYIGF